MLLSIWRHGESGPGSPDIDRTLTARGEAEVDRGGEAFAAQLRARRLPLPDTLLHSRWRRTTQTADRLCAVLPRARRETLEALIPDRDLHVAQAAVAPYVDASAHLVLVSHQPMVSALIDRWTGAPGAVPPLSPGAYAVLDLSVLAPGCATLLWWSAPPEYPV